MSLPKEPRQLMINLMYLVLTAMLALNVSSEILHAFEVINESISSSNTSIEAKNDEIYKSFQSKEDDPVQRDRIKKYNDKAKLAKASAENMIAKLEDWKKRVIEEAGGFDDEGEIKRKDNIDASTLLLVERKGGDTLKKQLHDLRESLLILVQVRSIRRKRSLQFTTLRYHAYFITCHYKTRIKIKVFKIRNYTNLCLKCA